MEKVGVRELRANLAEFLKKVQAGEVIVVTSRGQEISKLLPPDETMKSARKFFEELRTTSVVGDVLSPGEAEWDAAR
jgi:prevent-host-death family protein